MVDADDLFDSSEFILPRSLWFVCSRTRTPAISELISVLARAQAASGNRYIVAFTDKELADVFIESIGEVGTLSPFYCENLVELRRLLRMMLKRGEEKVAFDPGRNGKVRCLQISRIVEAIGRR